MDDWRQPLGITVLAAAQQRIAWIFDHIPRVYLSFSGGKDSTVAMHLVAAEARRRGRRVGLLYVDLEGQYRLTEEHIRSMLALYADVYDPYWVALPLNLRNAVSQYEPQWCAWEPGREADWIRPMPPEAISDQTYFPFYHYRMEFEEFVPAFGQWYSHGKLTACIVAIRADESLNRWRSIVASRKQMLDNKRWTTWVGGHVYNAYPIYDWHTADIWRYHGKTGLPHNPLYDRMHAAGMTIHQMRTCQPYGDDQRKGLWLFHIVEPETWGRVVNRVSGANQGALYAGERGNILGNQVISCPDGHTWQSYAMLLLGSMPAPTAEHYRNKIAVYLKWWQTRGCPDGIPDDGPIEKGNANWRRVVKMLLRNDYWAKGLSFTPTKTAAYKKYLALMRKRRDAWGLI